MARRTPRNTPYRSTASKAYSEHVGEKRQAAVIHGETTIWYARMTLKKIVLVKPGLIFLLQKEQVIHFAILRSLAPSQTALDSLQNQILLVLPYMMFEESRGLFS